MSNKETINITLKVLAKDVNTLADELHRHFEVVSFKHLPNTDKMYEKDPYYKKLRNKIKELKNKEAEHINANNYKYKDE